jgi:DNA polymerase I-like protein with 3'-5' exonuclease and polymerase domains
MAFPTFHRRSGVLHRPAAHAWQFFERRFGTFLAWQQRMVETARRTGWVRTRLGWQARVYPMTRLGTLLNWSIQAGASNVLRAATLHLAEAGFAALTTVHDALLVSIPDAQVSTRQAALVRIMEEAAESVVGVRIRVEVQAVRAGDRLLTPATRETWERVRRALAWVS